MSRSTNGDKHSERRFNEQIRYSILAALDIIIIINKLPLIRDTRAGSGKTSFPTSSYCYRDAIINKYSQLINFYHEERFVSDGTLSKTP